mgnify:CR=1 FL=1
MLGLELEQEFILTDDDGNRKDKYIYKITGDGVLYKSPTFFNWAVSSLGTIGSLLNGDVKAVPKPWKPEDGDAYWEWATGIELAQFKRWNGSYADFACWKVGNCFKTSEEAKSKGKEIMEAIQKEYEEA